jgi:hypothetical protein
MRVKNMIHNFSSYIAISNNTEVNAVIKADNENNNHSVFRFIAVRFFPFQCLRYTAKRTDFVGRYIQPSEEAADDSSFDFRLGIHQPLCKYGLSAGACL